MFITEISGSILTDQSAETVELCPVIETPFTSRERRGQKYLGRLQIPVDGFQYLVESVKDETENE